MDVKEVIKTVAGGIAKLSSKDFDEEAKADLVETLLGVISSITKYSRQMELQVELGTEREHDAIRMMEKFKKIARQQKILIDDLSEKEIARSRITTHTTETQSGLTGLEMAEMEVERAKELEQMRVRLKERNEDCAKFKAMVKKHEKTENKLRRIVKRSHEIIQAQEELMEGGSGFDRSRSRIRASPNTLHSESRNNDSGDDPSGDPGSSSDVISGSYLYGEGEEDEEDEEAIEGRGLEGVMERDVNRGFTGDLGGTITMHRALDVPPREGPRNQGGETSYGIYTSERARSRPPPLLSLPEGYVEVEGEGEGLGVAPSVTDSLALSEDSGQDRLSYKAYEEYSEPSFSVGLPEEDDSPFRFKELSSAPPERPKSKSPARSPGRSCIAGSVEKESRSPLRSSGGLKSPKESIQDFVDIVQQDDYDLPLMNPMPDAPGQDPGPGSPEARDATSPDVDREKCISPVHNSGDIGKSSFEEVDSLEDSFSMIQKYY